MYVAKLNNKNENKTIKRVKMKGFSFVFQVVVSFYEAASNIIIELDMDNSLFGFPRELVVAGVGKNEKLIILFLYCSYFTSDCTLLFSPLDAEIYTGNL